jgi:hypothetical protein
MANLGGVGDGAMRAKSYEVRFHLRIPTDDPERASITARDILLNPDAVVSADVFEIEYYEPADDHFPNEDHGWFAEFDGSVRPKTFFEFKRVKL